MLTKFDKNGNEVKLVEEKDTKDFMKGNFLEIHSLTELENYITTHLGRTLNFYNTDTITIGGVNITAWHRWFIPFASNPDMFIIVVYPDASRFYIIGRINGSWRARQVY